MNDRASFQYSRICREQFDTSCESRNIAKIQRNVFGFDSPFRDAPLKTKKKALRVTLEYYLYLATSCCGYYYIRQTGLRQRMKVYLRLLQQNRRSFWGAMQQYDHRQHLGHTESHVG